MPSLWINKRDDDDDDDDDRPVLFLTSSDATQIAAKGHVRSPSIIWSQLAVLLSD